MAILSDCTINGDLHISGKIYSPDMQIDVSSCTNKEDIDSALDKGMIPYYNYNGMPLYYTGVEYTQGGAGYVFCGIRNNVAYSIRFVFGSGFNVNVYSVELFQSSNVLPSTSTASWTTDNTNVPTRKAVYDLISSEVSSVNGGLVGIYNVSTINYYLGFATIKKGDWFITTETGVVTYNGISYNVTAGDEIYYTTQNNLSVRPSSLYVNRQTVTNLSNWNTLTTTGIYEIASQASSPTASPESGKMTLYVINASGYISQIAIGTGMYYRAGTSLSSASWKTMATTTTLNTTLANYWSKSEATTSLVAARSDMIDGYHLYVGSLPSVSSMRTDTLYFV